MFDEQEEEDFLIVSDDQFMDGNPIVRGTQITVEQILHGLAQGLSVEQILQKYPQLTLEGVRAALKFAAESVGLEQSLSEEVSPKSSQEK